MPLNVEGSQAEGTSCVKMLRPPEEAIVTPGKPEEPCRIGVQNWIGTGSPLLNGAIVAGAPKELAHAGS